jgi:hypothetical protein
MSEFNNTPEFDFESSFIDLMESNQTRDLGIASFEEQMAAAEIQLKTKFLKIKSGYDDSIAKETEDDLNDEWRFHNEVGVVSGRVYLADPELESLVPKEWGESTEDDNGRLYYFLENKQLKSHGVEAIPDYDDESETTTGVRMGFIFSFADDTFDRPILTAYLGELSKHYYTFPTPAEAQLRLTRQWPEELELIDILMKPKQDRAFAERLSMLARQLQEGLQVSAEFRDLATIYLNEKLALDEINPYIITTSGKISYFDGEDVDADDADTYWVHVESDTPITFNAFDPRVQFFEHSDGSYAAHVFAATFNEEDGDEPEYISVSSENITQFTATRALRSIAARALLGAQEMSRREQERQAELEKMNPSNEPIEQTTKSTSKSERSPSNYENGKPNYILEMEKFIRQFDEIAAEVARRRKTVYSTADDARDATAEFIEEYIVPRLKDSGVTTNFEIEASGGPALRLNTQPGIGLPDEYNHILLVGVNKDTPWVAMEDGDSFHGSPDSVEAFVNEEHDANGEVVGYTIYPAFTVDLPSQNASIYRWQGVDTYRVSAHPVGIVPFDTAVQVRVKPLERFNEMVETFDKASQEFNRETALKHLHTLQEALFTEIPNVFKNFGNTKLFSQVGKAIAELTDSGRDTSSLIRVLDTMFTERKVQLAGTIYANQNGQMVEAEEQPEDDAVVIGRIVDVRDDVVGTKPSFIIESNTITVAIPIETIRTFHF